MKLYQRFLPYGVAIGSTAIALLLSLWLETFLSRTIGAFFYIAIIVSAWYGGFRAGSVAIVLSMLAINYFFLPPVHRFLIGSPRDILPLGIFLMVALVINLLTSNFQESKNNISQLNKQLIQENAEQLRMALSAARMGMWDWNLVTGEVKWSPEHALLFGLEPGTFDGKYETFDASVHPEDRQSLNQAIEQALQTKSIYQHEFRVIWPDGSIHWVEGRGQGFYDQTSQAVRMTGTIMNVDDRKQTETLLHQQFEQQRLVMEISGRIRQSLNLQDILQTTVEEVRRFLQCDRALIFKIAPDYSGTILVESVAPAWNSISSNHTYDPCVGEEYIEPFKQGLVTAKSDIYTAQISPCHREMLIGFQVRANLVVPILQGQNLWGLLVAQHCANPRQWQDLEIDLLQQLATSVGIAIQQSELYQQLQTANLELQRQASLDGLTQLANRRRFDEYLHTEWLRHKREQQPLSLILFDADYFKLYNDTYGHLAGDDCLRQMAVAIAAVARRPADLVARYGGEEFAVVLPNTDAKGAMYIASTIRQAVWQLAIPHSKSSTSDRVTVSLGVATVVPSKTLSPQDLLNAADRALYTAKQLGRDRYYMLPVTPKKEEEAS